MKKTLLTVFIALACLAAVFLSSCSDTGKTDKYTVGICQLAPHPALDEATRGFKEALTEKLGDKVTFNYQNAAGDPATSSTICSNFVASGVDLIMANATTALQAASSATAKIPIIGTSITDYATALDIENWTGATGKNISGTSDLAPLDKQAEMVAELFPAETHGVAGILYCSGEPNSIYQVNVVKPKLESLGYTVKTFAFSDSNDVASVTQLACNECDVLYIPTDNTAAECAEAINNVALPAGKPIIAGEENICRACGVATLSISYYDIGYKAGLMAYEVLTGKADIKTLDIQFAASVTKMYNSAIATALGVTIPEGYEVIAELEG